MRQGNLCAVFVAATLIGIALVDRLGRKVLLVEGGIQMIITEIIVGVTLAKEFAANGVNLPANVSSGVLAVICLFIAGFAWSWGTIGESASCPHGWHALCSKLSIVLH